MTRIRIDPGQAMIILVPPLTILLAMLLCLHGSGARSLVDRPLALDEFHTFLVAGDPSFSHSWNALKRGADYNPPALYLLIRVYSGMTGGLDERSLRSFSLLSVFIGLVGVYALLRESFARSVAIAGTFATLAHPLLILHAFDARFYGPWFAATSWFCALLNKSKSDRYEVGLSFASIILCAIHYFGIISWALITASHLLLTTKLPRRSSLNLPALMSGPIALVACLLIFYPGQRSAISVPTWISKPGFSHVHDFLVSLFPALLFAIPGVAALVDAVIGARFGRSTVVSDPQGDPSLDRLAGATSLAFMPFAILGFTFLVQPAALARYAIPSVLVVGPVVAYSLRSTRRTMAATVASAFVLLAVINFAFCARAYLNHESLDVLKAIAIVRSQETGRTPVIILSNQREIAYQLWKYAPELRDRVRILHPSDIHDGPLTNYEQLESDVASRLHELYGTPGVVRLADLPRVNTIYLLTSHVDAEPLAEKLADYQARVVYKQRATCLQLSRR